MFNLPTDTMLQPMVDPDSLSLISQGIQNLQQYLSRTQIIVKNDTLTTIRVSISKNTFFENDELSIIIPNDTLSWSRREGIYQIIAEVNLESFIIELEKPHADVIISIQGIQAVEIDGAINWKFK